MATKREEDHRPWGYYQVLAHESDHKVKRIVVYPGKQLSLQRHRHRSEHWYIITGKAVIVRGEDRFSLGPGQSMDIPRGTVHRIKNKGTANPYVH